jgi:hypothetical protein
MSAKTIEPLPEPVSWEIPPPPGGERPPARRAGELASGATSYRVVMSCSFGERERVPGSG